jgi:hypothetical protein
MPDVPTIAICAHLSLDGSLPLKLYGVVFNHNIKSPIS